MDILSTIEKMKTRNLIITLILGLICVTAVVYFGITYFMENKEKYYSNSLSDTKVLRYGNYEFHDHGFGTPLHQTNWPGASPFTPYIYQEEGLYQ